IEAVRPMQSIVLAQKAEDHAQALLSTTPRKNWLILADRLGVGKSIAAMLTTRGDCCVLASPAVDYREIDSGTFELMAGRDDDVMRLLETIESRGFRADGVVHCWSIDGPSSQCMAAVELMDFQRTSCDSVLGLVQAFEKRGQTIPPLWLITTGAQPMEDGSVPLSVSQAPVWGLGRVVMNELPHVRCCLVDLSASWTEA